MDSEENYIPAFNSSMSPMATCREEEGLPIGYRCPPTSFTLPTVIQITPSSFPHWPYCLNFVLGSKTTNGYSSIRLVISQLGIGTEGGGKEGRDTALSSSLVTHTTYGFYKKCNQRHGGTETATTFPNFISTGITRPLIL